MKLKYPLRYYLTKKWIDVGGTKVLYTPADETHFRFSSDEKVIGDLHVTGSYSLVMHGVQVDVVSKSYAGEVVAE